MTANYNSIYYNFDFVLLLEINKPQIVELRQKKKNTKYLDFLSRRFFFSAEMNKHASFRD